MNPTMLQMLDPEQLAAWAHADPALPGLADALLRALEEQLSWRAQWEPLVTLLEYEGTGTLDALGDALADADTLRKLINTCGEDTIERVRKEGMR